MPFVEARGHTFHVQRLGDLSAGTPTVMVHGLLSGSLASWFFTCAPAVGAVGGAFLYDLRGHGRTAEPADGDYSTAAQVGDLVELTATLAPFHLVGHSFGALVAARFALAHPGRVASLVLVEPPVRADPAPVVGEREADGDPEAWWWQTAEAQELAVGASASVAGEGRLGRRPSTSGREPAILRSLRAEPELTDADLASLPAGLAVVLGERSPAVAMRARIGRVRPDATVLVLPAGHSVQVDATEALRAFLVDWIRNEEVAYG